MLTKIADELLPKLIELTKRTHAGHRVVWMRDNKSFNFACEDVRYAGVVARCDTAIELINLYLDGKTDVIEELEVERLQKNLHGFVRYAGIATPNLMI